MVRILLDTCILSALEKPQQNQEVIFALTNILDTNLYMSVVSLGEIIKGISLLENSKRKTTLSKWVQILENQYSDRILNIDSETAYIWGQMTSQEQKAGRILSVADGLIAASAKRHGLQLMTRNICDFQNLGITLINPWETY